MREVEVFVSNTQIEQYRMVHARKPIDISAAARLNVMPADKTIWRSVENLPWFIKKTLGLGSITFYINGIKDIEKLSRNWGLTNNEEELFDRTAYDEITISEFRAFTSFVSEELSSILDLPILNEEFSKETTESYFPYLTREVDAEVSLLDTMQAFSLFSLSQQPICWFKEVKKSLNERFFDFGRTIYE